MLEYIERKGIMGLDQSLAIQKSAAASRTTVELANCVDFARRTRDDVPSVALRLENFLEVVEIGRRVLKLVIESGFWLSNQELGC